MIELKTSYKTVYNAIKDAASIKAASDIVLKKFEIPADQSEWNHKRESWRSDRKRSLYSGMV